MRTVMIMMVGLVLLSTAPALQAQAWALKTPEAVLEANVEATGGAEAWANVKTIRREGTLAFDSPMGGGTREGTFVEHIKLPGYSHRESSIDGPMGQQNSVRVTTPEKSWVASDQGRRDFPRPNWVTLASAKQELALLNDDAYQLTALKTDIGDKGPMYVVSVEYEGKTYLRHYDQISLMLLAAETPNAEGGKEWVLYGDYREVDGLKIPHTWTVQGLIVMQRGGGAPEERTIEVKSTLEKIAFNAPVKDTLFSEE